MADAGAVDLPTLTARFEASGIATDYYTPAVPPRRLCPAALCPRA